MTTERSRRQHQTLEWAAIEHQVQQVPRGIQDQPQDSHLWNENDIQILQVFDVNHICFGWIALK